MAKSQPYKQKPDNKTFMAGELAQDNKAHEPVVIHRCKLGWQTGKEPGLILRGLQMISAKNCLHTSCCIMDMMQVIVDFRGGCAGCKTIFCVACQSYHR